MTNKNVWRGILIEEGFNDKSILEKVHIIETKIEQLEGEEGLGDFHFHKVEVDDSTVNEFVELASRDTIEGWFTHLINGSNMKVIFTGKCFEVTEGGLKDTDV